MFITVTKAEDARTFRKPDVRLIRVGRPRRLAPVLLLCLLPLAPTFAYATEPLSLCGYSTLDSKSRQDSLTLLPDFHLDPLPRPIRMSSLPSGDLLLSLETGESSPARLDLDASTPELKNPKTAMLLGGLVGFGAGQYYSGSSDLGVVFSLMDTAAFTALGLGIYGMVKAGTEKPHEESGLSSETMRTLFMTLGGVGLVASRVSQIFVGKESAERFNEKFQSFNSKYSPYISPRGGGVALKFKYRW